MNTKNLQVSPFSLVLAASLVLVAVLISQWQKLGLTKDLLVAAIRAVIQLTIVGFILKYIFRINNAWLTGLMILFIIFNAAYNAHKRAAGIPKSFPISLIAIFTATILSLVILVVTGAVKFIPSQTIPITGMIAGQAMVADGLAYRSLNSSFHDRREQVLEKLALGANVKQASEGIIRDSIKNGMAPSIDSVKTMGIVNLPGMMSGLMFAGVDPLQAVEYQIMTVFMILATTSLSAFIAVYLAYKQFYNDRDQLVRD
ncbi:ABC transporter permease [Lactobacillus selangorensis]|nr:iron export ABC transporter permease subunit FetB [Lactobacillus selangorensis]